MSWSRFQHQQEYLNQRAFWRPQLGSDLYKDHLLILANDFDKKEDVLSCCNTSKISRDLCLSWLFFPSRGPFLVQI